MRELRASFPGVEPWLAGYRDTLTLEMMRFRHFTEDAIARGDLVTVRKAFEFLHRAFETGNHHVRNRVVVSFLEHLAFSGSNGQAITDSAWPINATQTTKISSRLAGI